MASSLPAHLGQGAERDQLDRAWAALLRARRSYYEDPARALAEAVRCHEIARAAGDATLCARARALQAAVSIHRGDLAGALELLVEADRHCGSIEDPAVASEVLAMRAQLSFFTGSYIDALRQAELAVQLADQSGDLELRIFARRSTCMVFGNVGDIHLRERIEELLRLTIEARDPWEEALSRNDLACFLEQQEELEAAELEIERALAAASLVGTSNRFALAVIHSTRADVLLLARRFEEALEAAELSMRLLTATGDPNPYVLGATVRAGVQARMSLGQLDDARRSGEGALSWLGDRVPQTRSLILSTVATALREAGRVEEAYDALARSAELEREAFQELASLQRSLERATLETTAARRESEALAASHRELAQAHTELARRTRQLEGLQDQLRDQADRDWLTGLYNRRHLARVFERLERDPVAAPIGLAVLDLDGFKAINDHFGHPAGDQVLIRVARLLNTALRGSDIIVRSGGEEFLVVMPLTGLEAARACGERIRQVIATEAWEAVATGLTVTTSVGVAATDDPRDLQLLLQVADQRLYAAKKAGRNRVVSAHVESPGQPAFRAHAGNATQSL